MERAIIIIIFLLLAGGAGFYLGLRERPIEVSVREMGASTTETFVIKGEQVIRPISWPWYISRASAIGAYILMFLVIVWGMGMTTGFTYRLTNPVKAWSIHKYMSISLGILVLTHAFSLLFDEYIDFGLADVLVPFASDLKPFYLSLGIIGFYILLVVMFSSLVFRVSSPRLWRALHYLVYPLFVLSLIHGFFMGTDSSTLAMKLVYGITGVAFVLLLFYRFVIYKASTK